MNWRASWSRWSRWGLRGLVLLVVVHAGLSFVTGRRLVSTLERIEGQWGSLASDAYAPKSVPPERNQARALAAAVDKLDLSDADLASVGKFAAGQASEIASVLERNRDAFKLLDDAARRPDTDWELEYERLLETELPPLLGLRKLGGLNRARVLWIREQSGEGAAARTLASSWSISRSLSYEPILICRIVAVGLERETLALLASLLDGPVELSTLEAWSELIREAQRGPGRHIGLIGEMKLVNIYWDFESGTTKGGPIPRALIGGPMRWVMRPLFRENFRVFMQRMSDAAAYDRMPFHQRAEAFDAPPDLRGFRFYELLARAILPAVSRATRERDVLDGVRQLARVSLALRRYALLQGGYPGTLADLGVELTDPFSGDELVYNVEGARVTLESAGAKIDSLPTEDRELLTWSWPIEP